PGWKAGEIQWPAPHVLRDHTNAVIGSGYEGELFLPVILTPPPDLAPGSKVTLDVNADWLMCEEVCIPGSAVLSLTLPVSADLAKPDPAWNEKIRATLASLPRSDAAWKIVAARDAKNITLDVTPNAGAASSAAPARPAPKDLHF